jgi:hypothetical protein
MDGVARTSKTEYQRLAERWRRLAADATTPHARNHLLTLARQCEFLAGDQAAVTGMDREGAEHRDAPP